MRLHMRAKQHLLLRLDQRARLHVAHREVGDGRVGELKRVRAAALGGRVLDDDCSERRDIEQRRS